jgi:tetratricopeptide (TPR) repeat protein/transcriptional regulator with XRE-family HTH domain
VTGEVEDFAGLLRQLRDQAGLTQEELAKAAQLGVNTVSELERGRHHRCQKKTARLLAAALDLTGLVRELFIAAACGLVPATEVLAATPKSAAAAWGMLPPRPVPRELPADVTGFTGRAGELAELDRLLPDANELGTGGVPGPVVISAVSGTAGAGKTALAVRWAHRAAAAFPDGQLYVNLRGYDPDQPVQAVEALAGFLRALGVASHDIPLGEAERAARYRSQLAGRRMLVILDNAAALLRVLIGDRAETDPAAVTVLARQCAMLPLALRVAAERAAARPCTPLAELAVELAGQQERLDSLEAGGDPRNAVASVFSWSYRYLPDAVARMFRLLGLHPGQDWDQYAAAALVSVSAARASQLLGALARAHLIEPVGQRRYGMHDLLRGYAAGLAAGHESEQTRQAALTSLFDYYLTASAAAMNCLDTASLYRQPEPSPAAVASPHLRDRAAAVAWLDAELPTLTAVAAYTASNGWPGHTIRLASTVHRYLFGGHFTEGLTICGHALKAARDLGDRGIEAHALTSLGVFHERQGRPQQAASYHRRALTLARDTGDRLAQARALNNLAIIDFIRGRYQQATRGYRRVLDLDREIGSQPGMAIQLVNLSNVELRQGHYDRAAESGQQALMLAREIDDQYGTASALAAIGAACCWRGRYQHAVSYQRHALELCRAIGDRDLETTVLSLLSESCRQQGQYGQAARHSQQALALCQETGGLDAAADALNGTAGTLLATGQPGRARACHATALTLALRAGDPYQQARAHHGLARACQAADHEGQAREHWQHALNIYAGLGVPEAGQLRATSPSENQRP